MMRISNCVIGALLLFGFGPFGVLTAETNQTAKTYDIQMKTQIKGNAEQPNLIFILPWKSTGAPSLEDYDAGFSYFDHFLKPVNQDALELEHKYLNNLGE